jgi:ribosomal protein S3AE
LWNAAKYHAREFKVDRIGNVTEKIDKDIGRMVFKITGSVSANNFVDFDNMNLTGNFVHIQLKLLTPKVATIHIEILTEADLLLRLSVSTLYNNEKQRYLGRSLR